MDDLLTLAATVKSAKASWRPKQTDAELFGTLLERYPPVQLRSELGKFKGYALTREWSKFGRAFVNWMNKVEPQVMPAAHMPWVPPETIEHTDEERRRIAEDGLRQMRDAMRRAKQLQGAPT